MTALVFPTSPAANDTFTSNGKTFVWDGTSWNNRSGYSDVAGTANISFSNTTMYVSNSDLVIQTSHRDPSASPAVNSVSSWIFTKDGTLTFSDNTAQSTAYTGNTAGFEIGYKDVPQNYTNTSFTIALSDRGKHIYTANGTSQTITIANNSSVAFPIGTAISIVSQGAGTITVARGTGVTLYLASNNTSADRTISTFGMATLLKVATDTWFINGAGVS